MRGMRRLSHRARDAAAPTARSVAEWATATALSSHPPVHADWASSVGVWRVFSRCPSSHIGSASRCARVVLASLRGCGHLRLFFEARARIRAFGHLGVRAVLARSRRWARHGARVALLFSLPLLSSSRPDIDTDASLQLQPALRLRLRRLRLGFRRWRGVGRIPALPRPVQRLRLGL
ncbi:hypothetical protein FB451DRAFT_1246662 [Mycena latifolia]|nr:hypothetical protein FB451DRAFT_1246662 [Mycena latifolia]